jgi:hypothetical protein
MKPGLILLTAAVTLTAGCHVAPQPTPVITKLHTVSIHVKDHQVHEGVYRFLREDLQLPLVYEPVTQGERRYVGLWAGNLVLEPCGPYANITYATPDFAAIFCGLTFEACQSAQQSAEQLQHRQIKYKSLGDSFVIINDPNLCEGNLVASIMDNPGRAQEKQKHEALTSQLKEDHGGPLGLQYVSEIQVGYTDRKDIDAWKTLLAPARQIEPYQWQLSDGPALRLVKSPRKEIKAVVFKVNSLEAATHYLRTNDLLGRVSQNRVHVNAPDHWEFNIVLQE